MSEVKTPQVSRIEVLASGLDSPRKLSFGPDGALYVAEAGRGGTGAGVPSPSIPGAVLFYGATGAITRIQNGVAVGTGTGLLCCISSLNIEQCSTQTSPSTTQ